ncbi:MAG: M20/M25/M40 family metallo-hydrolase [Pseudomonadota bacterium]|jgi:acetylornithine deacetylase/succinyl-diaminopimelate desuccinylase-like protein
MDITRAKHFVDTMWDEQIVPTLVDYVRIPNKSPAFDPDWQANGHMDAAVALFVDWARPRVAPIAGAVLEVIRLEGRTPLLYLEIPGTIDDTVVLYGHLDKQPEMTGWAEGLGPWLPVLKGDRLYGRGAADDGYAMFGSIAAILALRDQGIDHARCVVLIEACEESGSYDLPPYVEHLADRIGSPSLVVCLDSGCGNYDQLWLTTSLRGLINGTLRVDVLSEGVHSGAASGIVPSSFRIARELLSRIEDMATGTIALPELQAAIPPDRIEQAHHAAEVLGDGIWSSFPLVAQTRPAAEDLVELLLNNTWRPQMAILGADGIPPLANAGNVLRPYTTLKFSFRIPPTVDATTARRAIEARLLADPPYGATVTCDFAECFAGWNAPMLAPWLERAIERASQHAFGQPPALAGEGGGIPFMLMLGERFPEAQFMITGVLGPHSNAHGPNEFLHIPTGKAVTLAVATVVAAHAGQD